MLDDIDRRILELLQRNARVSNADIAREIGMAQSATLERVRKLEERGVIQGYEARLDPLALGLSLTAFVSVRSSDGPGDASTAYILAQLPEVQEVHAVAGDDCLLLKIRARDTQDLKRILSERIGSIPKVTSTRTTIVLDTLKETIAVALDPPDAA